MYRRGSGDNRLYIGSGIRARGGAVVSSAAFSPLDIATLTAWYDFSDITTLWQDSARTTPVTADGDVIGGVTDLSGNGNHLAQATTANKPIYKVNIQNGLAIARFDTTDALVLGGDVALSTAYTLQIVLNKHATGENLYFSNLAADNYFRFNGEDRIIYLPGPVNVTGINQFPSAAWFTHTIRQDGTPTEVWKNGSTITVTANAAGLNWGAIGLAGSFSIDSDVGEIMVYSAAIASGDRTDLETYTNDKWAVYA